MNQNVQVVLVCIALFYLSRWIHGRAADHPEWQTFDALDRICRGVIVVAIVWIAVGLLFRVLGQIEIVNEITAHAEGVSIP